MLRVLSLVGLLASAPVTALAEVGPLSGPKLGAPAPNFVLRTIDGERVTLAQYRGKTLVLNVWATWCPPCREETPDLAKTARDLRGRNVEFLGVDITEDAPIVRAFVAAKGVPYAQAIDRTRTFERDYDVQAFPTTYVIDPQGVLRARYLDVATPGQLRAFVAAAQAGTNFVLRSPQQERIDALLAPSAFSFSGDSGATAARTRGAVVAETRRAVAAIEAADRLVDESDAAAGKPVDVLRTIAAEAALRDRAIAAFAPLAANEADRALLARMRGDAAKDHEQWEGALAAYRAALAVRPDDTNALEGVAFAAGRLERYALVARTQERLTALEPDSVEALVSLGITYGKQKRSADAVATFDRAIALARKHVSAQPGSASAVRKLAWTYLYRGRTLAKLGAANDARASFTSLLAWARKLPKTDERYEMYLEEGQEALVALNLNAPGSATTLSLSPWTGPELPGSAPNTFKYRLVVAGTPGRAVALSTAGLPKAWIASFCTDRLCAPLRVDVRLPNSGVKVIEFQLVPPATAAHAPAVRVIGNDGVREASATTAL
jgi:peroxiredoxin